MKQPKKAHKKWDKRPQTLRTTSVADQVAVAGVWCEKCLPGHLVRISFAISFDLSRVSDNSPAPGRGDVSVILVKSLPQECLWNFAGKTSETNNPSSLQREKRPSHTYGRQCAMRVCTVPLKLSHVLDMPRLGVPLASSSGEDFGEDQRCHGLPLGSCSKNPNGQGFCVWEYQYCGLIRRLPSNGHENRFKRCCLQRCCINPDLLLHQVTAPVQKANKF